MEPMSAPLRTDATVTGTAPTGASWRAIAATTFIVRGAHVPNAAYKHPHRRPRT